jgi:hypothetical protein
MYGITKGTIINTLCYCSIIFAASGAKKGVTQ